MARATMSRDGMMRVTIHMPFRMHLNGLADVLCMHYRDWTADTPEDEARMTPPELTKAQTEEAIRDGLWAQGSMTEGWADDKTESEQEAWTQWSERQVLKVWPGLKPESGRPVTG